MEETEVEVISQGSVRGDYAFACVPTGFPSATILSIENKSIEVADRQGSLLAIPTPVLISFYSFFQL